jgi:hypothetical protein
MNELCFRPFFEVNLNRSNDNENYYYFGEYVKETNLNEDYYEYYNTVNQSNNDSILYDNNSMNNNNKDSYYFLNLNRNKVFELRKRQKPGKKRNDVINNESDKNHYIHTKIKFDNILTKVQVSYVNFLVDFINIVLENFGRKDLKFKYIDSKIKKNNKISQRQKIKGGSIGDILNNKISCKYTTLDKYSNIILLQNLENEGLFEIIEILEQNFLFFFEKVYYKSLRKFNLKEFGLIDLEVVLPKQVKLFENLLMKNKNDLRFDEYKKKLEKCIQRHFLGGLEEELNSSDSSNQSEF